MKNRRAKKKPRNKTGQDVLLLPWPLRRTFTATVNRHEFGAAEFRTRLEKTFYFYFVAEKSKKKIRIKKRLSTRPRFSDSSEWNFRTEISHVVAAAAHVPVGRPLSGRVSVTFDLRTYWFFLFFSVFFFFHRRSALQTDGLSRNVRRLFTVFSRCPDDWSTKRIRCWERLVKEKINDKIHFKLIIHFIMSLKICEVWFCFKTRYFTRHCVFVTSGFSY